MNRDNPEYDFITVMDKLEFPDWIIYPTIGGYIYDWSEPLMIHFSSDYKSSNGELVVSVSGEINNAY